MVPQVHTIVLVISPLWLWLSIVPYTCEEAIPSYRVPPHPFRMYRIRVSPGICDEVILVFPYLPQFLVCYHIGNFWELRNWVIHWIGHSLRFSWRMFSSFWVSVPRCQVERHEWRKLRWNRWGKERKEKREWCTSSMIDISNEKIPCFEHIHS